MKIKIGKNWFDESAYYSFVLNCFSIFTFSYKAETLLLSYVIFVLNIGLMLIAIVVKQKKITLDIIHKYFLIFIFWCLASILWSIDQLGAIRYVFTIINVIFYAIVSYEYFKHRKDNVNDILKAIFIGGMGMVIYALYLYNPLDMLSNLTKNIRYGDEINQINTFGLISGHVYIIGLYFWNKTKKIYYSLFAMMALLAAISSGSSKVLALISLGTVFIFYERWKKYKILIFTMVIISFFAIPFILNSFDDIRIIHRINNTLNIFIGTGYKNTSTLLRIYYSEIGWNIFKDNIFLGVGFNGFAIELENILGYGVYSHNNYIEMLVSTGLIGACIYYSIYIILLINLVRSRIESHKLCVFFILIHLFLDVANVAFYKKETYIYLILECLALYQYRISRRDKIELNIKNK